MARRPRSRKIQNSRRVNSKTIPISTTRDCFTQWRRKVLRRTWIMLSCQNTPKALVNFSPGFELARTLGTIQKGVLTLKGFVGWQTLSGFNQKLGPLIPGLSLALQPWAEISQRLRRIFQLNATDDSGKIRIKSVSSVARIYISSGMFASTSCFSRVNDSCQPR